MTHPTYIKTALAALLLVLSDASLAQGLPPAIQALQKQGITIVGAFPSKTGLKAYAATAGGRTLSLYVTPGGSVIVGSALDDNGQEADEAALDAVVHKPLGEATWKQLEGSRWIADGRLTAPRIVYVFTDPNCPFCAKLWADARPWVDGGKVQLRHIIVGILTPTSRAKAAALLNDKNPSGALAEYEKLHAPTAVTGVSSGKPRPLGDAGLKQLASIPASTTSQLDANERLMALLGLQATPGIVWRDAKGAIQKRAGAPDSSLPDIFGPK